jgi:hypothetical protein
MNLFKTSLLKKYILQVVRNNFRKSKITSEYINIRCNVCGDSKTNSFKRRGYFLFNKHPTYICHNCNVSIPVEKWLKEYFFSEYQSYLRECILENPVNLKEYERNLKQELEKEEAIQRIQKLEYEQEQVIHFVNILKGSGDLFDNAIKYCIERHIPENVWKKWFIAVDGSYKDRLVIPFYDSKNKIYYYQARALKEQEPKYLNRLLDRDKAIYNIDFIDIKNPVIVTEGIIDSLMIENSVAVLGTAFTNSVKQKLEPLKCYYLLDGDEAGRIASKKMLNHGKYVFLWNKFLKDNGLGERKKWDMNDVCLALNKFSFSFRELRTYFTNSLYDKVLI